ncbi:hypothetical protein RB195_021259 [Necator americanus]|uniref:Uncharacterized protein n=1 Tax=Necator americanus TaxID=51031 RepID=A0ABR1EC55_NECAM
MTRARNRTTRRNQPDPTLGKELRAQIRDRLKFMHQLEAALEEETDPDHVAALKDIMKVNIREAEHLCMRHERWKASRR